MGSFCSMVIYGRVYDSYITAINNAILFFLCYVTASFTASQSTVFSSLAHHAKVLNEGKHGS